MSVVITKISVLDIEKDPNFTDLLNEYAHECGINGLPHPCAKIETYRMLDQSPCFQTFGAFVEDRLVGFITVLASDLPHYGVTVSVSESYFVAKEYRKTGAGLKLLNEAQLFTEEVKSPGLLVVSPSDGELTDVLSGKKDYRETNKVFFWKANNV